jgi:hypothetical protein
MRTARDRAANDPDHQAQRQQQQQNRRQLSRDIATPREKGNNEMFTRGATMNHKVGERQENVPPKLTPNPRPALRKHDTGE